jgi:hypothetical protein
MQSWTKSVTNGARKLRAIKMLQQDARIQMETLESRLLMTGGTWSTISTAAPSGAQMGVVLTNGTLLVHGGGGGVSNVWEELTPSNAGSYAAGTWSTVATSNLQRLYTATEVLQSGKVMVLGGEYSGSAGSSTFTNTGEIYDPVANTWSNITNFPQSNFGDDPTELMPNGNVLAGYISGAQTYIYNPTANTWTQTGTKAAGDRSDEESWVTLPDGSILSYNVFSSISTGTPTAQRYIPSAGIWVNAGTLPAQLSAASVGYEMGPGMMLPDGRAFFAGGTNATAYYTPSTNTWAAGPNMPNGYCMSDAPGVMLPDGDLLLVMSPEGGLVSGGYNFPSPSYVYELNPTTNVFTNVTPSSSVFSMTGPSFLYTFLVLPNGQVALMGDSTSVALFTETGTPVAAATPVISDITYSGTTGVYKLSGTNLNGINEGAAYGDDNEMASNYPLIRLTSASGVVNYATSTNWSLTGIDQGAETVTFTLPAADTAGAYLVQSVANGIPSATALAVLVNANTTTNVTVQVDATPSKVDVVGSGTIKATFNISSFSSIYFAGDNSGDTLTVNLNSNTGSIGTTIQAGTGTDTIDVKQTSSTGPVVIDPSTGADAVNVGTFSAGTAIAQFWASQQIGALTIGSGGRATLTTSTGTKNMLQASSIATSGTGQFDLTNNYAVIHTGNIATISGELFTGLNIGGAVWAGPGIVSSTASADTTHLTAVGAILNNNGGATVYTTFDGVAVSTTDVLLKYTYFGDANLSGKVDGSDYTLADYGFSNQLSGWLNGDFNYNGAIDGSDYTLIDNAFNTQGATVAALFAPSAATSKASVIATSTLAKPAAIGLSGWMAGTELTTASNADGVLNFSAQPIGDDWIREQSSKKTAVATIDA